MRATFSRADLVRSLATARQVVNARGSIPITSHVLVAVTDAGASVAATDLEVYYLQRVGARMASPGAITVDARRLGDFVRELPGDEVEIAACENGYVQVTSGKSRAKLTGLPAVEFPEFPAPTGKTVSWQVDGSELATAIALTAFSVADDGVRPAMAGLHFRTGPSGLSIAATDGHRLSLREIPGVVCDEHRATVPRAAVRIASKILSDQPVLATFGEQVVEFCDGTWVLRSRLIDAEYPDFSAVLGTVAPVVEVEVSRAELLAAVRRVSIVTSERSRGLACRVSSGAIHVSAVSPDHGEASESVECLGQFVEGTTETIGFNAQFVADVLEAVSGVERVTLGLGSPEKPAVVSGVDGWRHVVMPMRL